MQLMAASYRDVWQRRLSSSLCDLRQPCNLLSKYLDFGPHHPAHLADALIAGIKPGNRFSAPALDRISAFNLGNAPWRISRCPCSAKRNSYLKMNKVRRDLPGVSVQTFLEWPRAGQGEPDLALMPHNISAILKDPDQITVPPHFSGHDFRALRSEAAWFEPSDLECPSYTWQDGTDHSSPYGFEY